MSKPYILTPRKIWSERGKWWAQHYRYRGLASVMCDDAPRVMDVLSRYMPAPRLLVDASLYRGREERAGAARCMEVLGWSYGQPDTFLYSSLLCLWYWSEANWQNFVSAFNSLPDPVGNWRLVYDDRNEVGVWEPVDNSGGTPGELGGNYGGIQALPPKVRQMTGV